jgi:REP element-mobilizing transposase RayT
MRESWPHAPPHYFTPHGIYIITAATLHRAPLFNSGAKLDLFRDTAFELTKNYALILQAWAFFPNHYHVVIGFEKTTARHKDFLGPLASRTRNSTQPYGQHSWTASDVRILGYSFDVREIVAGAIELRPSKYGEARSCRCSERVPLVLSALV